MNWVSGVLLFVAGFCAMPAMLMLIILLSDDTPASVDTLPKGRDAKQARCASKGSAVPERQTPKAQSGSSSNHSIEIEE